MTDIVYNIARSRKNPFFTLDQFFSLRRAKIRLSWAKLIYLLFVPSVHNALWRQIDGLWGDLLSQSVEGV